MSADTMKAKLAIEKLRQYLAEAESDHAQGDHPVPSSSAIIDLIETYEWLLERRDHLAIEHEALKVTHAKLRDAQMSLHDKISELEYENEGLTDERNALKGSSALTVSTFEEATSQLRDGLDNPAPRGAGNGST